MTKKRKPSATPEDRSFRNDPESRDLTIEEATLFEAARQAVTLLKKTFETWTVIGKAVQAARSRADRIGGGKTFRRILEQQGLARIVPPATATRLLAIMHVLPAVNDWHAKQSEQRQIAWASPSAVFKHCPVFASAKSQAKATNRSIPKPRLEPAIDALVDHLIEMAEDERMVVLDRILSPFNLAATPTKATAERAGASEPLEPATAAPERNAKAAHLSYIAKEMNRLNVTVRDLPLEWVWVEDEKGASMDGNRLTVRDFGGRHTAQAERGHYDINAGYDSNWKFSKWQVSYWPPGAKAHERRNIGNYRVLKKAKAAAQRDYGRGGANDMVK